MTDIPKELIEAVRSGNVSDVAISLLSFVTLDMNRADCSRFIAQAIVAARETRTAPTPADSEKLNASRIDSIERVIESLVMTDAKTNQDSVGTIAAHMEHLDMFLQVNTEDTERKLFRDGIHIGTFTAATLDAEWKWETRQQTEACPDSNATDTLEARLCEVESLVARKTQPWGYNSGEAMVKDFDERFDALTKRIDDVEQLADALKRLRQIP
jgi:soluble cytochrome b562